MAAPVLEMLSRTEEAVRSDNSGDMDMDRRGESRSQCRCANPPGGWAGFTGTRASAS